MRIILLILSYGVAGGAIFFLTVPHVWSQCYNPTQEDSALATCLCSAFSAIFLYLTLVHYEKDAERRDAKSERLHITNQTEMLERDKLNLKCSPRVATTRDTSKSVLQQNEVTEMLLQEVKEELSSIHHYGSEYYHLWDKNEFLEKLQCYLSISSRCYYILYLIKNSYCLTDKEKKELTILLTFSLTPEDKQLLNIIFLADEYQSTISSYDYLFNEQNVKRQLQAAIQGDPYFKHISEGAIDAFIKGMKQGSIETA